MKSQNQMICEYVAKNPLCLTRDVAAHLGEDTQHMAKIMNQLEASDHLRMPAKVGYKNSWITGANQRFPQSRGYGATGNGGGVYYPTNGDIDRKRVVTVTVTATDALALLSTGYQKMRVF